MKPQPDSFLSQKNVKQAAIFSPISRESVPQKKMNEVYSWNFMFSINLVVHQHDQKNKNIFFVKLIFMKLSLSFTLVS